MYWHVERGSVVVHSQTLRASASEVAAMVEGAIRHGTTMSVEGNYVDCHGQSEIGFGVTRLLNIDLLPRIKRINRVRLYRPAAGEPGAYAHLAPALTRPIRWDMIDATTTTRSSSTPPRSAPAPPPPRPSCPASPGPPPTRPTRRCWRSAVRSAPASSPATSATASSNVRSKKA